MVCPPFPFFFFVMCFIKFWHVARKPIWGCVWQSWTFWKNVFWFIKLKNWLNIWSLLFIEFVLWMFIICCVPAQIPYLEKTLVLRCGSKCFSANQIASTISRFFACWYIFRKAKTCFKWFLGACSQKWTMTKRDSQNLHYETLMNEFVNWDDF